MIINKLTIENVGLLKGKNVFDLRPTAKEDGSRKSIILFGGKNGAGKTTIFEAILLCFYGKNIFEKNITNKEYHRFLISKIHRNAFDKNDINEASVELQLEHSYLGEVSNYIVKRKWETANQKVTEKLVVTVNGKLLSDVEVDYWQDFLNELIPPGISKLFFFDGEKIQNLSDSTNFSELKASLKSLLGLELVERLQSDLKVYISRNTKSIGLKEIGDTILELESEKKLLDEQFDMEIQEKAQKNSHYDFLINNIEKQEAKIVKEGGNYASKRGKLKEQIIQLDAKIQLIENEIRVISSELLPFCLAPNLCKKTKESILEENEYNKWKATNTVFESKKDEITKQIGHLDYWSSLNFEVKDKRNLIDKISHILDETLVSSGNWQSFTPTHRLSDEDSKKVLDWIDISQNVTPAKLKELSDELERVNQKKQKAEKSLLRAPKDDVLGPLIDKLNELTTEAGKIQAILEEKEKIISQIDYKLKDIQRQIDQQHQVIKKHTDTSYKIEMSHKVIDSLDEYIINLRQIKLKELSKYFLDSFNKLTHKEHLIYDIQIDENNFSIKFFDIAGNEIRKSQLSAGEKEMFSISMLWALTFVSKRELPFIIDTPLGRLDSGHRDTLVDYFFPTASKQMIIFSTDTEIDKNYFKLLGPHISRVYHLDYSIEERCTKVNEDYFWKREDDVIINAV